jgi:hypothetical protein
MYTDEEGRQDDRYRRDDHRRAVRRSALHPGYGIRVVDVLDLLANGLSPQEILFRKTLMAALELVQQGEALPGGSRRGGPPHSPPARRRHPRAPVPSLADTALSARADIAKLRERASHTLTLELHREPPRPPKASPGSRPRP